MAQAKSDRTQLINSLGIKDLTRDGYLVLDNKYGYTIDYADMLHINSQSLQNLPQIVIELLINNFKNFLSNLSVDAEIISIPSYINNHSQKTYWNEKLESIYNKPHKDPQDKNKEDLLNKLISQLKDSSNLTSREFILVLFARDTSALQLAEKHLKVNDSSIVNHTLRLSTISLSHKIHILKSIEHPGILTTKPYRKYVESSSIEAQRENVLQYQEPAYHAFYMHDRATGYYYSLLDLHSIVTDTGMNPFWLNPIMNNPNTISFLSFENTNKTKYRTSPVPIIYNPQKSLLYMNLHILVYAPTSKKLMANIEKLTRMSDNLSLIHWTNKNPQKSIFSSLLQPIPIQDNIPHCHVKVIQQNDLALSYMINQSQLIDPKGSYLGKTSSNGEFCFNPYYLSDDIKSNNYRTRVMSLITGNSGMGKTTLAKLLCDDAFIRNNHVFNIDFTGEYNQFTKNRHGLIIDPTKPSNHINMFQLFTTSTDEHGKPDIPTSYVQNTIRIVSIYKYLTNISANTAKYLYKYLDKFYKHNALFNVDVSSMKNDEFPTIKDFAKYINNLIVHIDIHQASLIYQLRTIYNATNDIIDEIPYSNYHTRLSNISSKSLVNIDISAIKAKMNLASKASISNLRRINLNMPTHRPNNLSSLVSDSLALNYLSYLIDLGIKNKSSNYSYINLDEAQHYFKHIYYETTILLSDYMLEARKDHIALTLIIPTIQQIFKVYANDDSYIKAVKRIFGLIQYFHLLQLTETDAKWLKQLAHYGVMASPASIAFDDACNFAPHQIKTIIAYNHTYNWTMKDIYR